MQGGEGTTISAGTWFNPDSHEHETDLASELRRHGNGYKRFANVKPGLISKHESKHDKDWGLVLMDRCPANTSDKHHWEVTCTGPDGGQGEGPYVGFVSEDVTDYGVLYGPVDPEKWQHAGFSYDQPNDTVEVFYNGELVANDEDARLSGDSPVSEATDAPVRIGANIYEDGNREDYFPGRIDDPRVYDRALGEEAFAEVVGATEGTYISSTKSRSVTLDGDELALTDVDAPTKGDIRMRVEANTTDGFVSSDPIEIGAADTYEVTGLESRESLDEFRLRVEMTRSPSASSPVLSTVGIDSQARVTS
jgi:hypothetical protein